jgi:hypothetical protein
MHDLQTILSMKREVSDRIKKAQEELHALEVVERMMCERAGPNSAKEIQPKQYRTLTQHQAIGDVLEKAGGPLTAADIAERLQRGGYPFKSKDPKGPIYAALKKDLDNPHPRYFFEKKGQIVVFGLVKREQADVAGAS